MSTFYPCPIDICGIGIIIVIDFTGKMVFKMLGYLFILLTVFFNVTKGGCSKVVSSRMDCVAESINLCFARNLICVIVGFFIILFSGTGFAMPVQCWLICALSGVSMAVNYIVWLMSLKSGAYMLSNTASSGSFVLAAVCGVILFKESLSPLKLLSFALVVVSVYFMLRYQTKQFVKPKVKDLFLLFGVFVTAGSNSVSQKLFTNAIVKLTESGNTEAQKLSANHFTFYTFVISLFVLALWRAFVKSPKKVSAQTIQLTKLLPYVLYMGLTLYGATFFQTLATDYLDSIVVYPLSSALALLGASIMAWLCFKEKPSKDSIIGGAFVLGALVLSKF